MLNKFKNQAEQNAVMSKIIIYKIYFKFVVKKYFILENLGKVRRVHIT